MNCLHLRDEWEIEKWRGVPPSMICIKCIRHTWLPLLGWNLTQSNLESYSSSSNSNEKTRAHPKQTVGLSIGLKSIKKYLFFFFILILLYTYINFNWEIYILGWYLVQNFDISAGLVFILKKNNKTVSVIYNKCCYADLFYRNGSYN